MARHVFGMISGYGGLTQGDWLWKQSPEPFGQWGNIQMRSQEPHPDFMLLYQYDFPKPTPLTWRQKLKSQLTGKPLPQTATTKTQLRGVPKERTLYLLREPPLEEVLEQNQRSYRRAQQVCSYVSGPDNDAPTPDYMPAIWYVNVSFRELEEMPAPQKQKPCSWITSGINRTHNHRVRLNFLKQVQESGLSIEFYGRNLPSWVNSGGVLYDKWHAMAPYQYNLAIENYADNEWYVSEKLWDSLLSWCLPIYYGGPAADKLLPPGSFLRLPSLDEKGIAYIQEVIASPDAWHEAESAIAEARQIILHKLNLMNWLSEYATQHG